MPGDRCDSDRGGERDRRVGVQALHRPEAHHRADEHHSLDAEIEHAGALREQLAERGVQERRPVRDARRDQDDEQRVVHAASVAGSRTADTDAIANEQLAAERREQDDPLHHADEAGWEVDSLQRVARVLQRPDEKRDDDDRDRVVARKRGHDDAGVAVVLLLQAVRIRVEQVAEVADLARAAQSGDGAGDSHHREDLAPRPHAGVARRARRVSEHLRLEAEARAGVEEPEHECGEDRDPATEREDVPARPERCAGNRLRRREHARVESLRLPPVRLGVEHEVREDVCGDVVEHQRRDDLVGLEERAQRAGDQRPGGAACAAGDDHREDHERRRPAGAAEIEPGGVGGDRAHEQLALGADVEQPHTERCRGREPGERERRGLCHGLAERAAVQERGVDDLPVARDRIVAGRVQDEARREEREDERARRDREDQPPGLAQPALNPHGDPVRRP